VYITLCTIYRGTYLWLAAMSPHHKVDRMKVEADSTGKAKMSGW